MRQAVFAIVLLAAAYGLFQLATAATGLTITRSEVDGTPVTVFSDGSDAAPTVVIAHGFAGSQQLMQPFAITLARSGYRAVTYDLLGHGRNPKPLSGDVTRVEGATANLIAQLDRVVDFASALPDADGRLALLGHSMATDVIVRYAIAQPDLAATVAVSMFSPAVTATGPKNLLVVVGAWETALRNEALRAAGLGRGGDAEEGVTYGDVADGSARLVVVSDHVEHVGVLYSGESLAAARDWLNLVFGRTVTNTVETRGLSLGLFFGGMIMIATFATCLLPRLAERPVGFGHGWKKLLPLGLLPAILTPLILWKAPVDFLPVPVGDYLAVHFLVYGLLTGAGLFLSRGANRDAAVQATPWPKLGFCIAATTLFCLVAIYLPVDRFVTSFAPTPARLPLIAAMIVGLLPYFIADEWLTRGEHAPAGAYLFTKLCFLASLAFAIALNLDDLFFLIIIVPVILVFFSAFGLISAKLYRRTGHPLVAGAANALLFAWAIAVTFPLLGS